MSDHDFKVENFKRVLNQLDQKNTKEKFTPFENHLIDSYYQVIPQEVRPVTSGFLRGNKTFSKPILPKSENNDFEDIMAVTEQTPKTRDMPFPGFKIRQTKADNNKKKIAEASNMLQLAKQGIFINAKSYIKKRTQSSNNLNRALKSINPSPIFSSPNRYTNDKKSTLHERKASTLISTGNQSQIEPTGGRISMMSSIPSQHNAEDFILSSKEKEGTDPAHNRHISSLPEVSLTIREKDKVANIEKIEKVKSSMMDDDIEEARVGTPRQQSTLETQQSGTSNIVRMVDRMLVDGALPPDALTYFRPQSKGVHRRQSSAAISNASSRAVSPSVPKWITKAPGFDDQYKMNVNYTKALIYDIVSKPFKERDQGQITALTNWLEKLDVFSKFPWDVILALSKKVKARKLKTDEVLCEPGDPANCLYIVYKGELGIFIGTEKKLVQIAKGGEYLGRAALDGPGTRSARLKALTETYVVILERADFQEATHSVGKVEITTSNVTEFVRNHIFLGTFNEIKKLNMISAMHFRKYYKNEIVYKPDDIADKFYIMVDGHVAREMKVTIGKENKWPVSTEEWWSRRIEKTMIINLPIVRGEIFGTIEIFERCRRKEKVIVTDDSYILSLKKEDFLNSKN